MSRLESPPVQLLKEAVDGETVIDRIVGTVFSEMAMLAPLLAAGAGRFVNRRNTRIRPSTTMKIIHQFLAATLVTHSLRQPRESP